MSENATTADAQPEDEQQPNAEMNALLREGRDELPGRARDRRAEQIAGVLAAVERIVPDEQRRARFLEAADKLKLITLAIPDVALLLDWQAVEADHDHERAVEKQLRALIARKPYYAVYESADGGAGRGQHNGSDMNTLIRRAAGYR